MSEIRIPFNKAGLTGKEFEYMGEAIQRGHISGDGIFTKKSHAFLEQTLGVPKALLTTSCTHALELSAFLLDLQPGDEVIVPSFTFVSTVNAFAIRGVHPVFIDIRPDTLNLDESLLEEKITARTRAIVVVHYAGVACEMEKIGEIAKRHQIPIIEDNAHGLFGKYKGQYLGTFGCLATQSFHETKNITCGEGGALLINDTALIERAEILREKGTNRSRFFRGQVDKYTWVDLGSSYLPSDILAAFLFAQLESYQQIQSQRQYVWSYYAENLDSWCVNNQVKMPFIPSECSQPYHMFYLLFPSLQSRTHMIEHLKSRGILSVFHYLPLHLSEMGQKYGGKPGDCPVTESVSDQLLRLPLYKDLDEPTLDYIVKSIQSFYVG
jgi:dTDP-4-amino-4,6-dideoxygalactose transaminase